MNPDINTANIQRFKVLLGKIGSGAFTSKGLTREESAEALSLILQSKATPAQIGAFMIAHRIRRPEPNELAGMLDTYSKLGPKLLSDSDQIPPICFGMPFDGRTKTNPIYPLTTLILLSQKQPIILQGGNRMPVKYGVTTTELFAKLGLELKGINFKTIQEGFKKNGFGFIHLKDHFPLAEKLIHYREEIGKRPPLATMEILWSAHKGKHYLISGFFHPPTEELAFNTLKIYGEENIVLIKGLEGGIDLSVNRKCTTRILKDKQVQRITLQASDYNLSGEEVSWQNLEEWQKYALEALNNKGPLRNPLIWNAGIYLWLCGKESSISNGIKKANECISTGLVKNTLNELISWRESHF